MSSRAHQSYRDMSSFSIILSIKAAFSPHAALLKSQSQICQISNGLVSRVTPLSAD